MLLMAGQQTEGSLGDNTKAQRIIKELYDGIVKEVFGFNIPYKFASTRAQLTELTATPAFGWDHQFGYPQGCERILQLVDEEGDQIHYPCRREVLLTRSSNKTVETDVLLTDQDEVFVKYLYLRTNPASWPGWFQRLVICHGAMQLVAPIKKDDFTALNIRKQFDEAYSMAKGANGAEDFDTNDLAQDVDLGCTDIVNAVQPEVVQPWDSRSLNRW